MISLNRLARRAGMLLTGWMLLSALGCTSMQRAAERMAAMARSDSSSPEAKAAPADDGSLEQPGSVRASRNSAKEDQATAALDPQVQNALASAAWVATVPKSDGTPPADRWRHPVLEALPPQSHASDFQAALSSNKPLIAANARLALVRYCKTAAKESTEYSALSTPEPLAQIVRQRPLPLPVRLAAAETLGKLPGVEADESLRSLLKDLASREQFIMPQYLPDLHVELLYALAARSTRASDNETPALSDAADYCISALAAPAANVRLAAVRAWVALGHGPLPTELLDRRADPDARVRGVVLEAIGKWPPEQARDYLTAALTDHDLTVRLASIRALGLLADDGSLKDLKRLLEHDSELVRAAAVASLAARGDVETLWEAAEDPAWHVRLAAARSLADHPSQRSELLAAKLLADASPHVQQQMAASLADWPLPQASPLLLSAMGSSGFLLRKAARDELAKRWPAAAEFSIDAPADSRAAKLTTLRQRWQAEFGAIAETAATASELPSTADAPKLATLLSEVQATDVEARRRAADRLAQHAVKTPLDAEAVETLCRTIIVDSDALVWRGALSALASNTGEAATRLVYAGLSHPAAEVRRRACEHLRRHPDSRHREVLTKSLEDADAEVIRTALRGLARCGASVDEAAVEGLLTASDRSLRVEAAECLVQLGAASGNAALERLALDADPGIRRQTAAAMGRAGDPELIPVLMRLLDDQGGVRQAALASLAEIAGKDAARTEPTDPPVNSIEEVRRWREWFELRK